MRGGSVFEGIPGYWNASERELYLFRVSAHMRRLAISARILRMSWPYTPQAVCDAMIQLVQRCEFREDIHVRPTLYFGQGTPFGYSSEDIRVGAFISAVPIPRNHRSLERGISVGISSWRRLADYDQPPRVKASGNYLNSRLAQVQGAVDGYDSVILLNHQGHVAETPGACVVMIRDGLVSTPDLTSGILESVTRATIIDIFAREVQIQVRERAIDRTELYAADEIFECGSAHEITPIVSVDGYRVGDGTPGPLTRKISEIYFRAVRGEDPHYGPLLTPVYQESDDRDPGEL